MNSVSGLKMSQVSRFLVLIGVAFAIGSTVAITSGTTWCETLITGAVYSAAGLLMGQLVRLRPDRARPEVDPSR